MADKEATTTPSIDEQDLQRLRDETRANRDEYIQRIAAVRDACRWRDAEGAPEGRYQETSDDEFPTFVKLDSGGQWWSLFKSDAYEPGDVEWHEVDAPYKGRVLGPLPADEGGS